MRSDQHSIGVVINYCTNDYRFIRHNVKRVARFASEVVISTSDHFFDGTPENAKLLNKTKKENPEANCVQFKFNSNKKIQSYWLWRGRRILKLPLQSGSQYWICHQRLFGYQSLQKPHDYILFLDSDEIIDDKQFNLWLSSGKYKKWNVMKFANYWYFRKPTNQAKTIEDTPLMIKSSMLQKQIFFDYAERQGMYEKVSGQKKRMIFGLDKRPMVHHYCWVRTKREMIKKVTTWGHNRDADWVKLVNQEFMHDFNGVDFVQGYEHRKVKPFINI